MASRLASFEWPARGVKLIRILNFASAAAFSLYGWDAGVIGGIIATPQFLAGIGNPTNRDLINWIPSAIILGDVVGLLLIVPVTKMLGRKWTLMLALTVALIGCIIQTCSYSAIQMIVGRLLLGFGNGPISAVTPIYLQECNMDNRKRSRHTVIMVFYGIAGTSIANWYDFGMFKAPSPDAWRSAVAFQNVFLVVSIVCLLGCPESPRYLYAQHKNDAADRSLSRLLDRSVDDATFLTRREAIQASIAIEEATTQNFTIGTLFQRNTDGSGLQKRLWTGIITIIGVPFFGVSLIIFYGSVLIESVGLQGDLYTLILAIINTGTPIGMLLTIAIIDKVGRKTILVTGGTVCTLSMLAFTIIANIANPSKGVAWGGVVCLIVFTFSIGASWLWLNYLYSVEILPVQYRSQIISVCTIFYWAMVFVIVYAGPYALANPKVGNKLYIWFILGGAIFTGLVAWLGKETRGLTLEEIDLLYATEEYKQKHADKMALQQGMGVSVIEAGSEEKEDDVKV